MAQAARRLATFGKRHGLSLGGMTIREMLHKSRPCTVLWSTPPSSSLGAFRMSHPKKRLRFRSASQAAAGLTRDLTSTFFEDIEDLNRFPVDLDEPATAALLFETTQALCRRHGLTPYDAAYLEIVMGGQSEDCDPRQKSHGAFTKIETPAVDV